MEIVPDFPEIVRRTGVGFVPVLITPEGEMLQDTTDILDVARSTPTWMRFSLRSAVTSRNTASCSVIACRWPTVR